MFFYVFLQYPDEVGALMLQHFFLKIACTILYKILWKGLSKRLTIKLYPIKNTIPQYYSRSDARF